MDRLKGWLKGLRALVRKRQAERELDQELSFHIEMETEKNVRQGMSPEEARRAALVAFGGVERFKEEVRDARWSRLVEDFWMDLRYALRALRRRPTFAGSTLLTLGLGLGVLATGYSLVYGVLLRPLPYPEGDRLVMVWQTLPGWERFPVSFPIYDRWSRGSDSFAALAAYDDAELTITAGPSPVRVRATPTTANLREVLGADPQRGRWFTPQEARSGARLAVVSHSFWRGPLGGDDDAIGRTLQLNDVPYTVIGVMPPDFHFPGADNALWLPLGPEARERGWNSQFLEVIGRLVPGATVAQADREVRAITARAVESGDSPEVGARVISRRHDVVGGVRGTLMLAFGAVSVVLLICCLNVANLFLARAITAEREFAVRSALGAGRGRLMRQMLAEGLLVAALGGALGLAGAALALGPLSTFLPEGVPRLSEVAVDWPVVLFVIGMSLAAGAVLGLVAALRVSKRAPSAGALRAGPRLTPGRRVRALRAVMVGGQVALVFALISVSALLLGSLGRLLAEERGFEEERLLTLLEPAPLESRYPDAAARDALFRRVLERLEGLPGVEGAALAEPLPFSGSEQGMSLPIAGGADTIAVGMTEASAGYFSVLGIELLRGRTFRRRDEGPAPTVAVVNRALARRLGGLGEALGQRMELGDSLAPEVIGVVADVRHAGLAEAPGPRVYVPYRGRPDDALSLVIRTEGDPVTLIPSAAAALESLEPTLAADRLVPLGRLVRESASRPRFHAVLLGTLATIAGLLTAVGIYGLTAFTVSERIPELGIRRALGARGSQIIRIAMGRELAIAGVGLIVGVALALALARALRGFLYAVEPADPRALALAALAVLILAGLAALMPAIRAVRSDPVSALRAE